MKYISHPRIRSGSLEERSYQLAIAVHALDGNTMVVLPTGLGKTAVAAITAASRLHTTGGKVLMLAPTKPLVEQHYRFLSRTLLVPGEESAEGAGCVMFTGETPVKERTAAWNTARVITATPQVIKNDVLAGRYSLGDVSLLIVDECHRAVGNYAYVFIAREYRERAAHPLILAMTASPGSNTDRVQEVCEHLGISIIESRIEEDPDVRPYIHEREVQYIQVDLPAPLSGVVTTLHELIGSRLDWLSGLGFTVPRKNRISMKALNALNASIQRRISQRDPTAFQASSVYAECMKLRHAIALAETQGSVAIRQYLEKLTREGRDPTGSKASRRLISDPVFIGLHHTTESWDTELHPKPDIVANLVSIQLSEFPESRVIVFASYRDTVSLLVDHLNERGLPSRRFVGQAAKDSEKGLSQKKQLQTLSDFRQGEFPVLVATSVGEEGLDVPSTDLVIFYEAVPSEIRSIQRKGRTGRHGSGRIIVLITRGTSDEVFRYVSQTREREMHSGILTMSRQHEPDRTPLQTSIESFVPAAGPRIIADDRETASRVVERLHSLGADLDIRRMESGDYAIGERILIERKTTRDFVDTLVERDLLGQIRAMANTVSRPVLIVEGDDVYSERNILPNAIRGALAAIAVDMGVSIFITRSPEETAEMIYVLARREGSEPGERQAHPHKAYRSYAGQMEYILTAFTGIGPKQARRLLAHFGTLRNVLNADERDLAAVEGVGAKTALAIADLAGRQYTEKKD
ncbi:MAG: DEAD/DEAH box helicase [Methanomicrobiaceae archaeon]|nr:DEAD/DEAH box helicase [Methanomicrobiaceae archaeon]